MWPMVWPGTTPPYSPHISSFTLGSKPGLSVIHPWCLNWTSVSLESGKRISDPGECACSVCVWLQITPSGTRGPLQGCGFYCQRAARPVSVLHRPLHGEGGGVGFTCWLSMKRGPQPAKPHPYVGEESEKPLPKIWNGMDCQSCRFAGSPLLSWYIWLSCTAQPSSVVVWFTVDHKASWI